MANPILTPQTTKKILTKKLVYWVLGGIGAILVIFILSSYLTTGSLFSGNVAQDTPPPTLEDPFESSEENAPPEIEDPFDDIACNDNDRRNFDAELCIAGEWVLCQVDNTTSPDDQWICLDGTWEEYDVVPEPPTCNDNDRRSGNTEICEDNTWYQCGVDVEEGTLTNDLSYICLNGEWRDNDGEGDGIQILDVDLSRNRFNPLIHETKFTYDISDDAEVEITITNSSSEEVALVLERVYVGGGESFVWWTGTVEPDDPSQELLPPGEYEYRVVAYDPFDGSVADFEEGDITLYYNVLPDGPDDPDNPGNPDDPDDDDNFAHDDPPNRTQDTGPSVILYSLLPLGGYIISRKKRNK